MTGDAIRKARERLNESQAEFGRRFGVAQQTIANWEKRPPERGAAKFAIERLLAELAREKAAS